MVDYISVDTAGMNLDTDGKVMFLEVMQKIIPRSVYFVHGSVKYSRICEHIHRTIHDVLCDSIFPSDQPSLLHTWKRTLDRDMKQFIIKPLSSNMTQSEESGSNLSVVTSGHDDDHHQEVRSMNGKSAMIEMNIGISERKNSQDYISTMAQPSSESFPYEFPSSPMM